MFIVLLTLAALCAWKNCIAFNGMCGGIPRADAHDTQFGRGIEEYLDDSEDSEEDDADYEEQQKMLITFREEVRYYTVRVPDKGMAEDIVKRHILPDLSAIKFMDRNMNLYRLGSAADDVGKEFTPDNCDDVFMAIVRPELSPMLLEKIGVYHRIMEDSATYGFNLTIPKCKELMDLSLSIQFKDATSWKNPSSEQVAARMQLLLAHFNMVIEYTVSNQMDE